MVESGDRLVALRRADSQAKAARVLAALETTVAAGETPRIAALAKRAGVSRRFIYDHPELRAEAGRRAAEVVSLLGSGQTAASARVSAASLRADLENAKARNRRLEADLAALRRRLSQLLGYEVMAQMADAGSLSAPTAARAEELEQALFEAQESLARRTEELGAAREINRELMAKLNRGGSSPPSAPSRPGRSSR